MFNNVAHSRPMTWCHVAQFAKLRLDPWCHGRGTLPPSGSISTGPRPCYLSQLGKLRYGLLASLLILCMPLIAAEKTEKEQAEEAEAAEEERILEKQGRIPDDGYEFTAAGRLVLATQAMDKDRPSVLGIFTAYGRTYQVKLDEESLHEKLKKFSGKTVTLAGKIRNKGKYFIVQAVLTQPGKFRAVSGRSGRGRM